MVQDGLAQQVEQGAVYAAVPRRKVGINPALCRLPTEQAGKLAQQIIGRVHAGRVQGLQTVQNGVLFLSAQQRAVEHKSGQQPHTAASSLHGIDRDTRRAQCVQIAPNGALGGLQALGKPAHRPVFSLEKQI